MHRAASAAYRLALFAMYKTCTYPCMHYQLKVQDAACQQVQQLYNESLVTLMLADI